MGWAKEQQIQEQQRWAAAEAIAVRAGVLERCPVCEDAFDPGGLNIDDAYRLGNALISRNDPLVEPFGGERRLMTDTVQAVVDGSGSECSCARHADD